MMKLKLLTVFVLVSSLSAQTQKIELKFIGNASFQISDGKTTLLSDFPYTPGAYGYMKYNFKTVKPPGKVLCLVTHKHADHFNASLLAKTDWSLLAPKDALASIPATRRLAVQNKVRFEDMTIYPITTPHSGIGHYSYVVEWHGRRFYFTGDTEVTQHMLAQKNIDVLFITPWLLKQVRTEGAALPAKKIVVYHQASNEKIADKGVLVLKQGETFDMTVKPSKPVDTQEE